MICTVEACETIAAYTGKGYCQKHYKRWIRHGDPSTVLLIHRFKRGHDPQRFKFPARYNKPVVGSLAHNSWKAMKQRCTNPKRHNYPSYGGKGITVCERWKSFDNFLADMGERPQGTSLDRIDSNGNYEPNNCRWATYKVQARNSGRRKVLA
jgi:hypothetical protein